MNYKILKETRVIISLLFLFLTLSVFTDIYEVYSDDTVQNIVFLQFVPSILKFLQTFALCSIGFIVVISLTSLIGRIYCSTICPLGILQDIIGYLAKKFSKKKLFYKKRKGHPTLRYSLLTITIIAFLLSFSTIITLLDPYSNFGRITTYIIRPVIVIINNLATSILHKFEVYTLNPVEMINAPWFIIVFTFAVFITVAYMSYKRGRLFCNTVCPVGTILGLISKASFIKIKFDTDKCTMCGSCIGVCKSECIDVKNHIIDHSRCVDCFNCLAVCNESALILTTKNTNNKKIVTDSSRRNAIITGAGLILGQRLLAESKDHEKTKDLKINKKDYPVSPPGSISIQRFNDICTGCGLCIAACPTQVLQPAINQYGLKGFMQPHMDYLSDFCNYDCNKCSQVCPTGAILPVSIEEKQLTQLGKAVFVKENCVVYTDGTDCGACSEHCPTKAVKMVPYEHGLTIPEVDQSICVGCGACEHPCPVEAPFKAIYVNGNAIHQAAEKPKDDTSTKIPAGDDFPF